MQLTSNIPWNHTSATFNRFFFFSKEKADKSVFSMSPYLEHAMLPKCKTF